MENAKEEFTEVIALAQRLGYKARSPNREH
jgi:homoserine dehydrogenase